MENPKSPAVTNQMVDTQQRLLDGNNLERNIMKYIRRFYPEDYEFMIDAHLYAIMEQSEKKQKQIYRNIKQKFLYFKNLYLSTQYNG